MIKRIILLMTAFFSMEAIAYNKGLSCIAYLSKSGNLEPSVSEKYTHTDLDKILDYIVTTFSVDRPVVNDKGAIIFANNLSSDKNSYSALEVKNEDLIFQNGVFYVLRSQDSVRGMLEQYAEVVGGQVKELCVPYE